MIDFSSALRAAREAEPAAIPEILTRAATDLGASDVTVYLADFGQTVLEPLPDRATHAELPGTESVGTTMAGRAFSDRRTVTAEREGGLRVWVPLLEGSDRTGVVALTLPSADDDVLRACEDLGVLAGYLIAAQARCTDVYNLHRRRRSMSLAASMQWDLLPPLVLRTPSITVAGLVEPAYDVGGDCFDYAANGSTFDFAVMDAMGHGTASAIIASLAMGCYRHDRREGRTLGAIHTTITTTIIEHYRDASFATGVLCRIDVESGTLCWINAGHPAPLLVRGGQVIGPLTAASTTPWGIAGGSPTEARESLEPGDCLLLYTDGVTEARTPDGEEFGVDRLIDLTNRTMSDLLQPEAMVRLLVQSVRDHQRDDLADDATVVLVRWEGQQNR